LIGRLEGWRAGELVLCQPLTEEKEH
jgi:hypothetical protein